METPLGSGFVPVNEPLEMRQLLGKAVDGTTGLKFKIAGDFPWIELRLGGASHPVNGLHLTGNAGDMRILKDQLEKSGALKPVNGKSPVLFLQGSCALETITLIVLRGELVLAVQSASLEFINGGVRLVGPYRMHKMQRRLTARYEIPGGYDIGVMVRDRRRRIFDVSVNGLGFLLEDPADAHDFRSGVMLNQIVFTLEGTQLSLQGQVVSQTPITEGYFKGKTKIGVRFVGLNRDEVLFLTAYVAKYVFGGYLPQ